MEEDVEAELASGSGQLQLASLPQEQQSTSAAAASGRGPVVGLRGLGGGASTFASMTMGMGRASRVLLDALSQAAKHAPTKRPHIIRPSQMAAQRR